MCSKLISIAFAFASLVAIAEDLREVSIEKQKELYAMQNRRALISREVITDGAGYKYIVEHWRNPGEGKPEWVTNKAWKVVGQVQTTTWASQMAELDRQMNEWKDKYGTEAKRVAAVRTQLTTKRAEYQEKYNKATALLKPIYKAFIDIIDALLRELDKVEA